MHEQPMPARKQSPWLDWKKSERALASEIVGFRRRLESAHAFTIEIRFRKNQPHQTFIVRRQATPRGSPRNPQISS